VGKLNYLIVTRLDVAYSVSVVSSYLLHGQVTRMWF